MGAAHTTDEPIKAVCDLPDNERRRIGAMLALLTRSCDGEVLSAAHMVARTLARYDMRPEHLAEVPPQPPVLPALHWAQPPQPIPMPAPRELPRTRRGNPLVVAHPLVALRHRARQRRAAKFIPARFARWLPLFAVRLTGFERLFPEDLVVRQWRRLSDGQRAWLRALGRKVPRTALSYAAYCSR